MAKLKTAYQNEKVLIDRMIAGLHRLMPDKSYIELFKLLIALLGDEQV